MNCRNCNEETGDEALCDLGRQPFANCLSPWLRPYDRAVYYPLRPIICERCGLVQLPFYEDPFAGDYPFRSGQSQSWKLHLRRLIDRLGIRAGQYVIEVGGNDHTLGDLLPYGVEYLNIDPHVDPEKPGALPAYCGRELLGMAPADYVIALNVMAHVPDLDDFCEGLFHLLKRPGTLVVEVQNVESLILGRHFDMIYHEHMTYFSPYTLMDALERRGFYCDGVPLEIGTHGGSLRATAHRRQAIPRKPEHLRRKMPLPLLAETPQAFSARWLERLTDWYLLGKRVVGYGAPAKATVWLNLMRHAGMAPALDYVVDSTPEKWSKIIPGSRGVRIRWPAALSYLPPDVVVILAWNYAAEILDKIPADVPEVWLSTGERVR